MKLALPIVALLLAVSCSSAAEDAAPAATPSGNPGDDGVGPYVSVAVDNHFHDIHPENHITIDADRAFVVRNEGSNLHNVTIVGADYSKDLRPGDSLRLAPVGARLEPGTYQIVCRFHGELGMTGEITVAET
ncbi:MAG: Cupredoxin-like domain [Actinomycetota bacterium]|jgi:plastocyanin|nr:Cupredoxin-like domain [Actinomycetota bacterium]